jgi:hypothetical protein
MFVYKWGFLCVICCYKQLVNCLWNFSTRVWCMFFSMSIYWYKMTKAWFLFRHIHSFTAVGCVTELSLRASRVVYCLWIIIYFTVSSGVVLHNHYLECHFMLHWCCVGPGYHFMLYCCFVGLDYHFMLHWCFVGPGYHHFMLYWCFVGPDYHFMFH